MILARLDGLGVVTLPRRLHPKPTM
jgi:hypothetical protein